MRLDIACNDPYTGLFDGKAHAVHVGEVEFSRSYFDWSPRFTEGDGWIRVGGKKLRCRASTYGVGNWCWNAYWCDDADVEALLNWVKFRKWFDIEAGPCRVFNAYKAGKRLKLRPRLNTEAMPIPAGTLDVDHA